MMNLLTGLAIHAAIALLMLVAWLDRTLQPKRAFPRDPAALRADPRWAIAQLRRSGALAADAVVDEVTVVVVKQQEAFRSQVAKVDVHYHNADGAAGLIKVFAKFAPRPDSLREHAVYILQQNHSKEVAIYRDLVCDPAYAGSVAAVRCYAAEEHAVSGGFCLLLERREPAREIAESAGCPADLAGLAMDAFADLHARTWNDEEVAKAVLKRTPPAVVNWLAAQLPGPDAALFARMLQVAWHHDRTAPGCVLHSDARVGNMLFAPEPSATDDSGEPAAAGDARFAFIDWQAARRGKAAFDVAYFMVLSVEPAVRRAHGEALLTRYYAALCARGVRNFSRAELNDDFRFGVLLTLGFVTLPLMSAEASTTDANREGINALGTAWGRRMVAVVEELDIDWVAARCGLDPAALAAAFQRSNDGAITALPIAAHDRAKAVAAKTRYGAGVVGAAS